MKWARSCKYNSTSQSFQIKPSHNPSVFPLDFPVSSVEPSRRQIRQSVELSGAVDPGVAFRDLHEIGFPNFFPTTLFCLKSKEMFDHISSVCPILLRKISSKKKFTVWKFTPTLEANKFATDFRWIFLKSTTFGPLHPSFASASWSKLAGQPECCLWYF